MINSTILLLTILLQGNVSLPFDTGNRHDITKIQLTEIGSFGLKRKGRPNIPEHHHTGIDIKRPGNDYHAAPIFPIAEGIVISKRTDGPYANIIIEHMINGVKVWALYEHIAGICVNVPEKVRPSKPIARFMNKEELNQYGWQFDHFHFELIKVKPLKIQPTRKHPERFFNAYTLICYSINDLYKYYYDPIKFLKSNL